MQEISWETAGRVNARGNKSGQGKPPSHGAGDSSEGPVSHSVLLC